MNCWKKGLVVCITTVSLLALGASVQAGGLLLKQGMQGEEVKLVQTELKKLGYFNENITGYYGEVTKQAVMKYQKDRKFSVDGIVGPGVWSSLVGNDKLPTQNNKVPVNTGDSNFVKSLRRGEQGSQVKAIQSKLSELGYIKSDNVTGYFGQVTEGAILKFQKDKGLTADGVVGKGTWGTLFSATKVASAKRTDVKVASRSESQRGQTLVSWETVQNIFSMGTEATVIDIQSGIKFNVKRSFGYNHADCETLTYDDTAAMKKAFGGSWSWDRRPIVVVVDGKWIAASMSGVPHAGRDDKPALANVSGRSGGYGTGQNLDTVKGNGMDGHFDIHFLNSKTHGTNKVDQLHQAAVKKAAAYIESR